MKTAKNATFLFQRDFMDYHKDRFEDHSLMVYENNVLKAVLPGNLEQNTMHSHQGLTYGGLVLEHTVKLFDVCQIFRSVLKFLNDEGIGRLVVKALPSIYSEIPSDELAYLMFLSEANCFRTDTLSVVDNNHTLPISNDRKNGHKRGVKHKLEVKEVESFEEFWNVILIPNLERKHQVSPVHSLEEITKLKQKFPGNIRQFNVYHNEQIVAGTTIFETKFVAHSQYISGKSDKNKIGSLDFLHMHLLQTVFQNKPFFDFGISNENQGKTVNKGLQYWKEGFGARTVVQRFYEVQTVNHNLLQTVFQ